MMVMAYSSAVSYNALQWYPLYPKINSTLHHVDAGPPYPGPYGGVGSFLAALLDALGAGVQRAFLALGRACKGFAGLLVCCCCQPTILSFLYVYLFRVRRDTLSSQRVLGVRMCRMEGSTHRPAASV
jgi:hypothetical protein